MRTRVSRKTNTVLIFALFGLCILATAVVARAESAAAVDTCLDAAIESIQSRPEQAQLNTLDGQVVSLSKFYQQCDELWPSCVLFRKFYYWKSDVRDFTSDSSAGPVSHKVRMYTNPLSACDPKVADPRKTYADAAEFYDANGVFMGIVVYMGDGHYTALPHSGYAPSARR